jgi:predicted Zn-dependent protease with MMP-like domain
LRACQRFFQAIANRCAMLLPPNPGAIGPMPQNTKIARISPTWPNPSSRFRACISGVQILLMLLAVIVQTGRSQRQAKVITLRGAAFWPLLVRHGYALIGRMFIVSDDEFSDLIDQSFDALPKEHRKAVKNVAIVYADEPTENQRDQLRLACNETLYGLYEGTPLSRRQGVTHYPPDKITIFKGPMQRDSEGLADLRAKIHHTLWHEIAHYFGLNHDQIHKLER